MTDPQPSGWQSTELVAWTEREGPGRPPSGPRRWLSLALAGALTVAFFGIIFSDSLCPEHRLWVHGLASAALVLAVTAATGLVRGWAMAPALTVLSALAGVAIGVLDAVHEPTRGRVIVLAFGCVLAIASILAAQTAGAVLWRRRLLADLERPAAVGTNGPPAMSPDAPPEQPAAADEQSNLPVQ